MGRLAGGLRTAALVLMATWAGGFAFYGAGVLPVLHHRFGIPASAGVTRAVTDRLNLLGLAALPAWWAADRLGRSQQISRSQALLLGGSAALLAALIVLHRVMENRIDAGLRAGFYGLHRAYLLASTGQWLLNTALLIRGLPRR